MRNPCYWNDENNLYLDRGDARINGQDLLDKIQEKWPGVTPKEIEVELEIETIDAIESNCPYCAREAETNVYLHIWRKPLPYYPKIPKENALTTIPAKNKRRKK